MSDNKNSTTAHESQTSVVDTLEKVSDMLHLADVCSKCSRYEDMARLMKRVVDKQHGKLDSSGRNYLSTAYKNVVSGLRAAWRVISAIEHKSNDTNKIGLILESKSKVENELEAACKEVLEMLDTILSRENISPQENVFYLKMRGDYWRYMAEYRPMMHPDRAIATTKAGDAYAQAMGCAEEHLQSTNPDRLGLALNYSVFYHEMVFSTDKACHLVRSVLEEAMENLEELQGSSMKDSMLILQLLRDNLSLWTSEEQEDNPDDDISPS